MLQDIEQAGGKVAEPIFKKTLAGGLTMLTQVSSSFNKVLQITSPSSTTTASQSSADIQQTISHSLNSLKDVATTKQITVNSHVNIPAKLTSLLTSKELDHLITTLVGNAIEFSQPGQEVNLVVNKVGHSLAFSVSDSGEGIPKEKLELLMQPFNRVTDTKTFDHQGLGMNLYISRLIAEKHQGMLHISSELGKGTTAQVVVG